MRLLNLGLLLRAWRETLGATVVFMVIIGSFGGLLSYALPRFQERFLKRGFVPPGLAQLRNTIMGVDSSASGVAEIAYTLAWSHPVIVALLFAHAIIVTTRVPSGEIQSGTLDVLLGLPISRWELFISETTAWLLTAAFVVGSMFAGSYIGSFWVKPENQPNWSVMGIVLANLAMVYVLIGVCGLLASVFNDRRGRAVLFVMIFAAASVLVNYLELLWEPAKRIGFLSVLHYYRPALILREAAWQWKDMAILGGASAALWTIAGVKLARRDLATT